MILIVDDKQENLFSLKTLLQLNLYEVDTSSSGEEALKKILKNEYELVILDVQMPGMDGYEVAEIISGYSKSKDIPIIFLSAVHIDKNFIKKGYASGGVDYVTKPFDADLLLLKIKTFCRLYKQTKELNDIKVNLENKVEERTVELQDANQELKVKNEELQQYTSIASHDLQEPLRKIIIFGDFVKDKYLQPHPKGEEYMNKVISSSKRMQRLIKDLLDYSKLSLTPAFTFFNLKQLVQDTIVDLELAIEEKEAKLVVEDLPSIEIIPAQMRQVFQNLLTNALKFAKPGVPPVIKIWGEKIENKSIDGLPNCNGPYYRLYIADNGIGFNELYAEKIFNMFQRLHLESEYGGTGIGLSIVKKIVEKHNGLITAKSKEGEGATFIIVLPIKQASLHTAE